MAKLTLLQIVNNYADMTDGFRVSSIDDTIESQIVASIAEKVFYEIQTEVFNTKLDRELVQLEALADPARPNYLRLPDDVLNVERSQVMYNIVSGTSTSTLKLAEIPFMAPHDFLNEVGQRSTNQTNTEVITDASGYKFVIQNTTAPKFYTSFDDEHLVFDSYDNTVDTTLQASKSGVLVSKQLSFTQSDTYVVTFPEWFHQGYQSAVIAEASIALREEPLPLESRKAKMAIFRARKKLRVGSHSRTVNYGRNV